MEGKIYIFLVCDSGEIAHEIRTGYRWKYVQEEWKIGNFIREIETTKTQPNGCILELKTYDI